MIQIKNFIFSKEKERDNEFERSNYIDLLITEYFMVSNFLTLTGLRFVTISCKNKY